MSTKLFGAPIPRRADDRLLKGEGRYLDDLVLPGMLHVAILRSSHPAAVLKNIDLSLARAVPGVVDAVCHADMGLAGQPFPQLLPHHGLNSATWSALAPGRVCFVGEGIAAVVAETAHAAVEGIEAIEVDYEALDPVIDLESTIRPETRQVHPQAPKNIAMHLVETVGDPDAAMKNAPHRIKERFRITRGGGMPIEPRGNVAEYDEHRRELTVWSSTQEPHMVRNIVATHCGLARNHVRVIAPDTGGGFGTKLNVYPEEVLIPWLALRLRRPVKWVETRSEHMLSATQEREQIHDIEVGFDVKGKLLALKNTFFHDMGAFAPRGGAVPHNTSAALIGPYRIPHVRSEIHAVYTNTAVVSAYRGAGQPQGVFVIERTMDCVAAHLGLDPGEVRFTNTIGPEAFPYDTGLSNLLGGAVEYESGDFIGTLTKALELADYKGLRKKQAEARKAGRHYGIGIANYVELTGRGPWEGGGVRIEPDGSATVYTGAPSQGQGHETVFAQICADHLGISIDKVRFLSGDTSLIPHGIGTFASRVGVLAGNAVRLSAVQVKEKIVRIAADLMEAAPTDLVVEDGRVHIAGTDKGMNFAEVARHAQRAARPDDEEPGLEAVRYFKTSNITYSNGTHIVTVEVDIDTCTVAIDDYAIAHDCGRLINPMIVEGQILGGIACGIGNSLLEEHVYNSDGQLLSGSFMDYAMPLAIHMPSEVKMVHQETPSTLNPLGVKGVGEAGTIPVPAAICNAVEDALRPLGIKINEAPLTQARLWKILQRRTAP